MIILLENNDVKVSLLSTGASIYKIETKDKNGNFGNITLTHEELSSYENGNSGYLGATCGRFAGRIRNGEFNIDGISYQLEKNSNGIHTLHGGSKNLSHVNWKYKIFKDNNKQICTFAYFTKEFENGFPGNLNIMVQYILGKNTLEIKYFASSDEKTYLNLTNHSFFNLSNERNLYNHTLEVDCDRVITVDEDSLPENILNVENTAFDFREPKEFIELKNGNELLNNGKGYDNPFILNKGNKGYDLILSNKESGRSLKVESSYPAVVLYSYNSPNDRKLLDRENCIHAGLAIEAQYVPNSMNDDRFFIPIIDKENNYSEYIKYTFN